VRVNGVRIDEPYVDEQDPLSRVHLRVQAGAPVRLGDNRPRSCDSREFGLVPATTCAARSKCASGPQPLRLDRLAQPGPARG
jgi:hypothetical protein